MKRSFKGRLVRVVLLLAVAGLCGNLQARAPERTDAGVWDGTWYYVNRDFHLIAWFQTVDGEVRLKLRYEGIGTQESFETDWGGDANYFVYGKEATFTLNIQTIDSDTVKGYLDWKLSGGNSGRFISGAFTAYRVGEGLFFAMHFDKYRRVIRRRGVDDVAEAVNTWTFRKASNRLADSEELPF